MEPPAGNRDVGWRCTDSTATATATEFELEFELCGDTCAHIGNDAFGKLSILLGCILMARG